MGGVTAPGGAGLSGMPSHRERATTKRGRDARGCSSPLRGSRDGPLVGHDGRGSGLTGATRLASCSSATSSATMARAVSRPMHDRGAALPRTHPSVRTLDLQFGPAHQGRHRGLGRRNGTATVWPTAEECSSTLRSPGRRGELAWPGGSGLPSQDPSTRSPLSVSRVGWEVTLAEDRAPGDVAVSARRRVG